MCFQKSTIIIHIFNENFVTKRARMKHIFTYFFLSLLILKIGGYFGMLCIEREIVREEIVYKMAKSLNMADLQKIIFSDSKFKKLKWERENKEFWHKNNLYDVVQIEKNAYETVIFCLSDTKETEIENQLADIAKLENESAPLKNNSKTLLTLVFQKYLVPVKFTFQGKLGENIVQKSIPFILEKFKSPNIPISSPPPII